MSHRWRTAATRSNPIYTSPAHRLTRAALIRAFKPGDPCCLCGHPMLHARYLEADHQPHTEQYRGLAHGSRHRCQVCGKACNSSDGARRGAQAANRKPRSRIRPLSL